MALNGSISGSILNGAFTVRVDWTATQNISNNTSTITAKMYLILSSSSSISIGSRTNTITIDGKAYTFTSAALNKGAGTYLLGTVTSNPISHNSAGAKSFSISAKFNIRFTQSSTGTYYENINCAAQSFTLNTIPRKSSLSVSNGTLGIQQTLTVSRASSSFTHTIVAKCGSITETVCTKDTRTSIPYTPPFRFASQNRNAHSVPVGYTITTYNGSTSLGSNYYEVTCEVPYTNAEFVPTVQMSVQDGTVNYSKYGGYVKGKSTAMISITATGKYDAYITSYSTMVDGNTYSGNTFTTNPLRSTGTVTVTAKATDTRGSVGTETASITVLDYADPQVSVLSVTRCNSDGSENKTGAYLKVTWNSKITSLNSKNSATYSIAYKKASEADYGDSIALTAYTGNYTVNSAIYLFAADTGASYDVQITATDDFKGISAIGKGSSIKTGFSWWKNKFSWAFGKVAEHESTIEVDESITTRLNGDVMMQKRVTNIQNGVVVMDLYQQGDAYGVGVGTRYDPEVGGRLQIDGAAIVESGENENGKYIRWADGTQICTKNFAYRSTAEDQEGALYYGTRTSLGNYAAPFIGELPQISATIYGLQSCFIDTLKSSSLESPGTVNIYRTVKTTSKVNVTISIIAIGRWK